MPIMPSRTCARAYRDQHLNLLGVRHTSAPRGYLSDSGTPLECVEQPSTLAAQHLGSPAPWQPSTFADLICPRRPSYRAVALLGAPFPMPRGAQLRRLPRRGRLVWLYSPCHYLLCAYP